MTKNSFLQRFTKQTTFISTIGNVKHNAYKLLKIQHATEITMGSFSPNNEIDSLI